MHNALSNLVQSLLQPFQTLLLGGDVCHEDGLCTVSSLPKHRGLPRHLISIRNGLESCMLFVAKRAFQAVALQISFLHCISQSVYSRISYGLLQLFNRVFIEACIECTISAGKVNMRTRFSTTRPLARSALAKMR